LDSTYAVRWIPSSAKFVVLGQHPKGTGLFQIYELDEQGLTLIKEVKVVILIFNYKKLSVLLKRLYYF
jgi:hypothetical protein